MPLRFDPVLLRQARDRAAAKKQSLDEYVAALVRRDLARKPRGDDPAELTVKVHPSLRRTIRRFASVPVPREPRQDREARDRLVQDLLDVAGIPR